MHFIGVGRAICHPSDKSMPVCIREIFSWLWTASRKAVTIDNNQPVRSTTVT